MSTSVTNHAQIPQGLRRMKRYALVGICLSVFCIVFTLIYEHFSYGAYSAHMRCIFLLPLVGCDFVGQICQWTGLWKYIGRICFNLWNAALATLAAGLLLRGIVNISGRFTSHDKIFYLLSCLLIAASLIAGLTEFMTSRSVMYESNQQNL